MSASLAISISFQSSAPLQARFNPFWRTCQPREFSSQLQRTKVEQFQVAWLASDTSASFNYLAQNAADISITYHAIAESVAIQQGIADRCEYAWRDHWMLIGWCMPPSSYLSATQSAKGPKANPAKLPTDGKQSIYSLFAQIFRTAIDTASSKEPVRFLSRYDKSAANIAESRIWTTIGQTPWAHPYSPWYHRFVDFPFQALRAASRLGEYTIMDRGTWCAIEPEVRDAMAVFVSWLNALPRLARVADRRNCNYHRQRAPILAKTIHC